MPPWSQHFKHWQLDPEIAFLNHGSFGAAPTVVLQTQRNYVDLLEQHPIRFLAPEAELEPKLDSVRETLSDLVQVNSNDLAFVKNATDGVNAVLRSFPFNEGDEVVVTSHGYNACNNAVEFAAQRAGALVKCAQVPFPVSSSDDVMDAISAVLTNRTRLLVVDHVTSATALIFPLEQIIKLAHQKGIRVLVDGAHALGMLPLNLRELNVDYYTANHHKWLCAPKASGFLYVNSKFQAEVRPTIISHAANQARPGRSRFLSEFDWQGTFDPSALLSVPDAFEFISELKSTYSSYLQENHALAVVARNAILEKLAILTPAPSSMIGSMATFVLPNCGLEVEEEAVKLKTNLYEKFKIEVPVFIGPNGDQLCFRISTQAYNCLEQYEYLAECLLNEMKITN